MEALLAMRQRGADCYGRPDYSRMCVYPRVIRTRTNLRVKTTVKPLRVLFTVLAEELATRVFTLTSPMLLMTRATWMVSWAASADRGKRERSEGRADRRAE